MLGCSWVITHDHGSMVLFLNSNHQPGLDIFFKYWTYLGDGFAVVGVILLLLIIKKNHGIVLIGLGVTLFLVSTFLKKVVFGKVPRPSEYFGDEIKLNFVEGVKTLHWYSFPSGHTMTAFVLAGFMALTFRNTYWSVGFLLAAILVAVSRIYLNQHFLIDTLVGGSVGLFLAWIFHKLFRSFMKQELSDIKQNN